MVFCKGELITSDNKYNQFELFGLCDDLLDNNPTLRHRILLRRRVLMAVPSIKEEPQLGAPASSSLRLVLMQ